MPKIFSALKLKIVDGRVESSIKKLDSKYLKSGKVDAVVQDINGAEVDSKELEKSYKYLHELSEGLKKELYRAMEVRSYKGYKDKNGTYDNLALIVNCFELVSDANAASSIPSKFFKRPAKNSVNNAFKAIQNAKKGFLAKSKVNDALLRAISVLNKIAFAPIEAPKSE